MSVALSMTPHDIDREHDRLGYALGWRFMMAPERNLRTSKIALISLNPAGDTYEPNTSAWSQEGGSAYVIESWKKKGPGQETLQRQVQGLCRALGTNVSEAFSAVFVPFRSPSWDELPRRNEAKVFARVLWRWVLPQSPASTFICIGKEVGPEIATILGARPLESKSAGWGQIRIDR
jgi:hypothetical protein